MAIRLPFFTVWPGITSCSGYYPGWVNWLSGTFLEYLSYYLAVPVFALFIFILLFVLVFATQGLHITVEAKRRWLERAR